MIKVTGIGGVFLYANDPKALAVWYSRHLGIELTNDERAQAYYTEIYYHDLNDPSKKLHTVFAIMRRRKCSVAGVADI